jgi:hypothetical protein
MFSETIEVWNGDASSVRDKEIKLDQLLMQPWENSKQGMEVQLPFQTMERGIPNGEFKEAGESELGLRLNLVNSSC